MTEKKILKGSKKLMLKPPGSAGKSTGYNLQEAMGLDKKVHQYNYYLVSICVYSLLIFDKWAYLSYRKVFAH